MTEDTVKKLPVIEIMTEAVSLMIKNSPHFIKSLMFTGSLIIIIDLLERQQNLINDLYLQILFVVVSWAILTLFAITCHRTILLGNKSVPSYGVLSWSNREWKFIWWSIVTTFYAILLIALIVAPASMIVSTFGLTELLIFPGILPGLYIFSRLSLLFPATAIEKKVGWDWAIKTSKNNGWRLLLATWFIPTVFMSAPVMLYGKHFAFDILLEFLGVIMMIFGITVLSLSFKFLSEGE